MERTSNLPTLSQIKTQVAKFKQQPRPGQLSTFEALGDHERKLCVKLPTGYGKTYTALGAYSILKSAGIVNRMLIVFPTDAQLQQFCDATPVRLRDYAIDDPRLVDDVRFFGAKSIQKHSNDKCQIFAITVQSLIGARGMDNISKLLDKGRWLVVIDEYHHYGIDKPFSAAVNALSYEYLFCMSATPYRPSDDSAFGEPQIDVSYRQAVKEGAVKELQGHAYHYKIDAIDESGELVSFTTEELIAAAGGDSQEKIEKLTKKMRFSPKYISPLITNPIDRMMRDRLRTGRYLQAIIGCMSVSHANLVYEQVHATFPGLNVDWVGTGTNGRSQEENNRIIKAFAPTNGDRPGLDILVHVGMAGEGLDTVNVSEVIHLNAAGVNNSNNQENGRAARYLPGVLGHINFDGCSGYAKGQYTGQAIMDAMDCMPASSVCGKCGEDPCVCERTTGDTDDWLELPEQPEIRIHNLECIKIDSGDTTVQMMIELAISDDKIPFTREDFVDPDGEATSYMIKAVQCMRKKEAEAMDEKSIVIQWSDAVDSAVSVIAGNVIRMLTARGVRVDKSMVGDLRRRINGAKKRDLGAVDKDIELLKRHYQWLKQLEVRIQQTKELPSWLA
jgi:superfamily II DNA or RNA helicase